MSRIELTWARTCVGVLCAVLYVACSRGDVIRVGSSEIPNRYVDYRDRLVSAVRDGLGDRTVAAAQLIDGYLARELLRAEFQIEITDEMLRLEEQRVLSGNTPPPAFRFLDPIFGKDEQARLYVGILPDFARYRLQKEWSSSMRVQEHAAGQINELIGVALTAPESFVAEAGRRQIGVRRFWVHPGSGVVDLPLDVTEPTQETMARVNRKPYAELLYQQIRHVGVGKISPLPLTIENAVFALRRTSPAPRGGTIIDAAYVGVGTFDDWFWREATGVAVQVTQKSLRDNLNAKINWAAQLKIAP